jgi:hypothetical protein
MLPGALFFNLSAPNVDGKFTEKGGATKLLHMVFTVAKEPVMGPAVIYIDEVRRRGPPSSLCCRVWREGGWEGGGVSQEDFVADLMSVLTAGGW